MHNRYPVTYHCTGMRIARRQPRPIVRFQRSGWTGSAACADNVWGGDPTTVWDYDGLESALRQALGMGMSGVSRWGSDIGGYHSFGQELTPELLKRWIQLGAVSGVMRTKRSGLAVPPYDRPQVFDPEILPTWKRYTKLHTQLYPYILAADARYRRNGMPLMRALVLAYPDDARAAAVDDQFLFGPDLLAAPVVTPGATRRSLYLPRGRWVDLWRSVSYDAKTGGLVLGRVRELQGGRELSLPAPLAELPLLARAGAVIPLLPSDVDTLADYGGGGIVRLRDRRRRLDLLAFPRGRHRAGFFERGVLSSRVRRGSWALRVRARIRRSYRLQASTALLRPRRRRARRFRPRCVRLNGRRLGRRRWRFDSRRRVLVVRFRTRRGRLLVSDRRCRRRRR